MKFEIGDLVKLTVDKSNIPSFEPLVITEIKEVSNEIQYVLNETYGRIYASDLKFIARIKKEVTRTSVVYWVNNVCAFSADTNFSDTSKEMIELLQTSADVDALIRQSIMNSFWAGREAMKEQIHEAFEL